MHYSFHGKGQAKKTHNQISKAKHIENKKLGMSKTRALEKIRTNRNVS